MKILIQLDTSSDYIGMDTVVSKISGYFVKDGMQKQYDLDWNSVTIHKRTNPDPEDRSLPRTTLFFELGSAYMTIAGGSYGDDDIPVCRWDDIKELIKLITSIRVFIRIDDEFMVKYPDAQIKVRFSDDSPGSDSGEQISMTAEPEAVFWGWDEVHDEDYYDDE